MNKYYLILFLSFLPLHAMDLEKVVVEKSEEKNEPFFPSLKILAAKRYAKKYKKLPENPVEKNIPNDCLKYIKAYLPITKETVDEQYAFALKSGDHQSLEKCENKLVKKHFHLPYFVLPTKKSGYKKNKTEYLKKQNEKLDQELRRHINFYSEEFPKEYRHIHDRLNQCYKRTFKKCCCLFGCYCSGFIGLAITGLIFWSTLDS